MLLMKKIMQYGNNEEKCMLSIKKIIKYVNNKEDNMLITIICQ